MSRRFLVTIFGVIGISLVVIIGFFLYTFKENTPHPNPKNLASPSGTETQPHTDDIEQQSDLVSANTELTKRLSEVEQKLDSLEASYSALINEKTPAKNTPTTQVVPSYAATTQTIFLGSDSTTNRSWTETGVEITLNSTDYNQRAQVKFEAGLSIIGGEAWARLKNKTTGAIIDVTEVSHNTDSTTWKGSPAFALHEGRNIYVVELRSSSGERAHLDGSRLIIN